MGPWARPVSFAIALGAAYFVAFPIQCGEPGKLCADRLRRQAVAILLYATDNDETLPPASRWMDATAKYLKTEAPFHCPDLRQSAADRYGYALNRRVSGISLADKSLPRWGEIPLAFDSILTGRNVADELTSISAKDGDQTRRNNIHFATVSYLDTRIRTWVDGHPKP